MLQKLGKSIRILLQNALHTVVWSSGQEKIPCWLHNLSGAVLWHRNSAHFALPEDTTASLLWDRNLWLWSQNLNLCKPTVPLSTLSFLFPLIPVSLLAFQPFSLQHLDLHLPFSSSLQWFPSLIPLPHCLLFLLHFISSTSLPGPYSPSFSSLLFCPPHAMDRHGRTPVNSHDFCKLLGQGQGVFFIIFLLQTASEYKKLH